MEIAFLLKIAGIGMLVSILCQVLNKSGRDEQATMVSLAGIILVLLLLVRELSGLLETVRSVFGI